MPVDVENPDRVGVRVDVVAGQAGEQLVGFALGGQRTDPAAQCLGSGARSRPIDPAQVGRVDPAQALGAGLADGHREHHVSSKERSP